jgi:hypothetical protein
LVDGRDEITRFELVNEQGHDISTRVLFHKLVGNETNITFTYVDILVILVAEYVVAVEYVDHTDLLVVEVGCFVDFNSLDQCLSTQRTRILICRNDSSDALEAELMPTLCRTAIRNANVFKAYGTFKCV